MEEKDLKILEEYLEEARDENSFTDCEGLFEDKFFISLDKLLKQYKELEEENEISEEEKQVLEAFRKYKEVSGSNSWVICNPSTMWSEYFIPISVIQNKIDEVNNSNGYSPVNKIFIEQVLQELLEKRNK